MEPLVALAVAVLAVLGAGSYMASVRVVRRCRRTLDAARTRVLDLPPGPRREAARVRIALAAEVERRAAKSVSRPRIMDRGALPARRTGELRCTTSARSAKPPARTPGPREPARSGASTSRAG